VRRRSRQKIAAGNVPNFVDLQTGGWGSAIQDPLNSGQTPTMANFATLADVLAGCITRATADAWDKLFAASTPPKGPAPTDTLSAAQSIARYPWYRPERLFSLLDEFYPLPAGKMMRSVPFMPYLKFSPSAWVLPLKFDGGGYRAGGKAMFDSEGSLWVGDNFIADMAEFAAGSTKSRLTRRRHRCDLSATLFFSKTAQGIHTRIAISQTSPPGCQSKRTAPLSCSIIPAMTRLPKPLRVGGSMGGPPVSVQRRTSSPSAP
jgi:hypothetical protein